MNNIQSLYESVMTKKINKDEFRKHAIRMFPNIISNFNSFEETTKILKQRGMLFETTSNENYEQYVDQLHDYLGIHLTDEDADNLSWVEDMIDQFFYDQDINLPPSKWVRQYAKSYQDLRLKSLNENIDDDDIIAGSNLTQNGIKYIESKTDYDVLNHNKYTMDVMNRHDSDNETYTLEIEGKNVEDIIEMLNKGYFNKFLKENENIDPYIGTQDNLPHNFSIGQEITWNGKRGVIKDYYQDQLLIEFEDGELETLFEDEVEPIEKLNENQNDISEEECKNLDWEKLKFLPYKNRYSSSDKLLMDKKDKCVEFYKSKFNRPFKDPKEAEYYFTNPNFDIKEYEKYSIEKNPETRMYEVFYDGKKIGEHDVLHNANYQIEEELKKDSLNEIQGTDYTFKKYLIKQLVKLYDITEEKVLELMEKYPYKYVDIIRKEYKMRDTINEDIDDSIPNHKELGLDEDEEIAKDKLILWATEENIPSVSNPLLNAISEYFIEESGYNEYLKNGGDIITDFQNWYQHNYDDIF